MRARMESHSGLCNRWDDGERKRSELCEQFLDGKPKSLHKQWPSRKRPTVDIHRKLLCLRYPAKRSHESNCVGNDQQQHHSELDRVNSCV